MPLKKSTKILIIGAGSIGTRHLKNLLSFGFREIAVSDPEKEKTDAIRKFFPARVYREEGLALRQEKPKIVFVCSPTDLHLRHANLAVDEGADVFVEKPLAADLKGVDALIKKADAKKTAAMVGCNYRFNRGWLALRRALTSGRYGKPILARVAVGYYLPAARKNANYKKVYAASSRGGGVVLDSGSHVIDYLVPILGKIKSGRIFKSGSKSLGIQGEEAAIMCFEHESGVLSSIVLDFISKLPLHRVEIATNKGLLVWDFITDKVNFYGDGSEQIYRGNKNKNAMFVDELKHFLECVEKRKTPLQDLEKAKEVLITLAS